MRQFREAISESFGLPKDVIMNLPKISLTGDREIYVENYKRIIEYGADEIRLATNSGTVHIKGRELRIKLLRHTDILITGFFTVMEYET